MIGLAHGYKEPRIHRTLDSAFGPYSRLDLPKTRNFLDRIVGVACVAIIAGVLAWNFWGTL
jgi:hypothetical protein